MDKAAARNRLVAVVCTFAAEKRTELERLKQEYSGLARPDFIWHYLLQSFSTMGRAAQVRLCGGAITVELHARA
jgi:hypothetical protein